MPLSGGDTVARVVLGAVSGGVKVDEVADIGGAVEVEVPINVEVMVVLNDPMLDVLVKVVLVLVVSIVKTMVTILAL